MTIVLTSLTDHQVRCKITLLRDHPDSQEVDVDGLAFAFAPSQSDLRTTLTRGVPRWSAVYLYTPEDGFGPEDEAARNAADESGDNLYEEEIAGRWSRLTLDQVPEGARDSEERARIRSPARPRSPLMSPDEPVPTNRAGTEDSASGSSVKSADEIDAIPGQASGPTGKPLGLEATQETWSCWNLFVTRLCYIRNVH
jgi:hypothetical protein